MHSVSAFSKAIGLKILKRMVTDSSQAYTVQNMIMPGYMNSLMVEEEKPSGFILKDPSSGQTVFMQHAQEKAHITVGEQMDAFVFLDKQGEMVASAYIPFATVGEYALLTAVDVADFGAFFDWGIEKDLLVPGNCQRTTIEAGQQHVVLICIEEKTDRLFGTTKIEHTLQTPPNNIRVGDAVSLVPFVETDLGYKVIIDHDYMGMIYHNEIFTPIVLGDTYDGRIQKIRPDNLIDAALQGHGIDRLRDAKQKILDVLQKHNGALPLSDKSTPETIQEMLYMSKKTFKSAIGMLYKAKKITIYPDRIELALSKKNKF